MSFANLRQSLRSLSSSRGFLVAAILTLALGIGANTAIFSVVNGLLLKPLPYPDGEQLVQVYNQYPKSGLDYAGSSIPDYLDRREAPGLADLALYSGIDFNLAEGGTPQRLVGIRATPSLFSTLQIGAQIGRVFGEAEAELGQDKVVVLSFSTWKNLFNGDPAISGREVRFSGEKYRVLGVMPEGFAFPNKDVQVWVPFAFTEDQRSDNERGNEYSESIGRMRPGVSVAQLDAQFAAIVRANGERISSIAGQADNGAYFLSGAFVGRAKSLREQWVGQLKPVLLLLQAVVGLVLLIACANVANLLLTRLSARQKEFSVRAAMGAGRWHIARQLLCEALLLALAGGLAGIAVACLGLELLRFLGLDQTQLGGQISIDGSVLLFTLGVAIVTGLLFGTLAGAGQQVVTGPLRYLRDSGSWRWWQPHGTQRPAIVLVVVQLALAVSLLVAAGLLLRSFLPGPRPASRALIASGVLTTRLSLAVGPLRRCSPAQWAFYERLLETGARHSRGASMPDVTSNLPFSNDNWTASYEIAGRPTPSGTVFAPWFCARGRWRLFQGARDPAEGRSLFQPD